MPAEKFCPCTRTSTTGVPNTPMNLTLVKHERTIPEENTSRCRLSARRWVDLSNGPLFSGLAGGRLGT